MLQRIASWIIRHHKLVIIVFVLLAAVSGVLATRVKVNYDLSTYIPDEAPSTLALNVMQDEFDEELPNVDVMVPDITIAEALEYKAMFQRLPFVHSVLWLDDQVDIGVPLAMHEQKKVEAFYKDGVALFYITTDGTADSVEMLESLQAIVGEDGAIRGQLVDLAKAQTSVKTEISRVLLIAVPLAFFILIFATKSWFEPVLFMIVIFCGVLLNMGTNIIFEDISFITQSVGAVLQLAVSMDFAIFLLHRVTEYRNEGHEVKEAVKLAVAKSMQPIISSALTTVFGFLTLVFMRFKIGPDLGLVLAKGVMFSLISVFMLLPALLVVTYKLIDKTTHRSLLPSFKWLGKLVLTIGIPVMIIIAIIIVPVFMGQQANYFLYGMGSYPSESREARDEKLIQAAFGENMQMALLAPRGEWAKETEMIQRLDALPEMKSIIGYTTEASAGIPPDILPQAMLSPLLSEHYSRIMMISNSPKEAPETFALAETIREIADEVYGEGRTHLVGENFVITDMKETINQDNVVVNGIAVLAIALVIALAFQSLTLPLILVLTIEISIWINLSLPYFMGSPLSFIGYLVISTVQLGATVDYGILLSQYYLDSRKHLPRKEAASQAVADTAGSLLTPALILAGVSFTLYFVSTNPVVWEIGLVLGRGALLSFAMVIFLLPNLLRLFDRVIEKTTRKVTFLPDRKSYGRKAARSTAQQKEQ